MTDQTTDRSTFDADRPLPADQTAPRADRLAHPEAVREQVRRALDFTYAVALGYESSDELLATYDASRTPVVDQTTPLRDRIAAALYAHDHPSHVVPLNETGMEAAYRGSADAVLAVLPATTDQTGGFELRGDTEIRAAALREAVALLDQRASSLDALSSSDFGEEARAVRELADAANELRRMADETQPTETEHQPRRGDQFEAWLKTQRDDHRDADRGQWTVLDDLLDRYRLHADMGTPLGGHVCEARVVGDCECLEQPAAGARQDGAQSPPPSV